MTTMGRNLTFYLNCDILHLGHRDIKEGGCIVENNLLYRIRRDVENCVGKHIIIRANKGRKKIVKKRGIIESAYPNLFVVKIEGEQAERTVSYTYSDVLTRTVQIAVCANQETALKIS